MTVSATEYTISNVTICNRLDSEPVSEEVRALVEKLAEVMARKLESEMMSNMRTAFDPTGESLRWPLRRENSVRPIFDVGSHVA